MNQKTFILHHWQMLFPKYQHLYEQNVVLQKGKKKKYIEWGETRKPFHYLRPIGWNLMEQRIRNKENEAILESVTLDRLQNFIHISIFRLLYVIIYRGIKEGLDEGQNVRASQVMKRTTDFFCFK